MPNDGIGIPKGAYFAFFAKKNAYKGALGLGTIIFGLLAKNHAQ